MSTETAEVTATESVAEVATEAVGTSDTRSDVAAAIASLEAPKPEVKAEAVATEVVKDTQAEEPKTEVVKTEEVKKEEVKVEPAVKKEEAVEKTDLEDARWQDRLAKAPASWKPTTRELWEQVPNAARLEIHRRESETFRALSSSKEAKEFISSFKQITQPYEMLLSQEGGPINGFQEYLKTATLLRMGTPQEKAAAVASAITQFSIPVELLDQALVSAMGGAPQPGAAPRQADFRDPRVDGLLKTLSVRSNAQQSRMVAETDEALYAFASDPANEYFNDVRNEMADILEIAAKNGRQISLQTAYRQATMLHPEVSKAVENKKLAAEGVRLAASAKAAKAAAVSVTGAPTLGAATAGAANTVRGAIEASISQLSGR